MSALDDRRQAAREAFHDASPVIDGDVIDEIHEAAEQAIETAIRVRVTSEIIEAARVTNRGSWTFSAALEAAFHAAGFEVET